MTIKEEFRDYLNENKIDTLKKAHKFYIDEIESLYRKIDNLKDNIADDDYDWDPNDEKEIEKLEKLVNKNAKKFEKISKDLDINMTVWEKVISEWDYSISLEKYLEKIK